MTASGDWPERAWWSVALVDALVVFLTVVVGPALRMGAAVPIGLAVAILGFW